MITPGKSCRLRVFDDDRFDDVGSVFALVCNDLHYLVDLSFLYYFLCVGLCFEQTLDAKVENIVGLVLDSADYLHRAFGDLRMSRMLRNFMHRGPDLF